MITLAWHSRVFESLFGLLLDMGNLWERELSAAKEWYGKFSLAAHLNWVGWCLPCTKLQISSGQLGYVLHRWFEVGFILPWELSPSMKGTACEPSSLWQPGTPNWNGCAGKGWAAESSEQLILLLLPPFFSQIVILLAVNKSTQSAKQYRSSPHSPYLFLYDLISHPPPLFFFSFGRSTSV